MFTLVLTIHILIAITLVTLILLQHGKGADAGAAFGSGSAGSVFGARGANSFLYKLSASLAAGFFATSLALTYLATNDIAPVQQGVVSQGVTDLPPEAPTEVANTPEDVPQ